MPALHRAIENHNDDDIQSFFTTENLLQRNEQGLNPLQLAAREGLLSTVIALLEAGVNPDEGYNINGTMYTFEQDLRSPLYFATTYGHFFVARVLYAFGADVSKAKMSIAKNPGLVSALNCNEFLDSLTADKNIISNLIYHGIIKNKTPHLEKLLEQLQSIPGEQTASLFLRLTEFALIAHQRNVALKIFALAKVAHTDPNIPSAGYWDAKNNKCISADFCRTEADRALTLLHLSKFAESEYLGVFNKESKRVQKLMTQIYPVPVRSALKGASSLIYQAALKFDLASLNTYYKNHRKLFSGVFEYAYLESNFTAAYAIASIAPADVKKLIITTLSPSLIQFGIIILDFNLLDIAFHINISTYPVDQLSPFLKNFWSRQGLMSMLVNLRLMKNAYVKKEDSELFDKLADPLTDPLLNQLSLPHTVARGIEDRYHIPLKNISIIHSHGMPTITPYFPPEINPVSLLPYNPKLRILFFRFGMTYQNGEPLPYSVLENMNFDLYKIVLSFLGQNDFNKMAMLSHYLLERSASTKLSPQAQQSAAALELIKKKAQHKLDLEKQIETLQFFTQYLVHEERKIRAIRAIIFFILCAGLIIGTAEIFIKGVPIQNADADARDLLKTQTFNYSGRSGMMNATCEQLSVRQYGCEAKVRVYDLCDSLCSHIGTPEVYGYFAGMIILPVLTVCTLGISVICFSFRTILSDATAERINQGWGDENNPKPFAGIYAHAGYSHTYDIKYAVKNLLVKLEAEYKNSFETPNDRIVEIKDEKKEDKDEVIEVEAKEEIKDESDDDEDEMKYTALAQIDADEEMAENDSKQSSVSYLGLWSTKRKNSREAAMTQATSNDGKLDDEREFDENVKLIGRRQV